MALAAEFQGFARDLHDDGISALLSAHEDGGLVPATLIAVVKPLMTSNRRIDRGNPDPSALGEDFGRFGLSWWTALAAHDPLTPSRQEHLQRLTIARNGIAHADENKLDRLRADGFPMTLHTVRRWHRAVDRLTVTMDSTLRDHLGEVFGKDIK